VNESTRGRPVRGAVAGLFFGLFVSLDLLIFGVVALDADILAVVPVLGLLAGVALGLTAPLHRRPSPPAPPEVVETVETTVYLQDDKPAMRITAESDPATDLRPEPQPDATTV
jgi:hypothetical protein